MVGWGWLTTHPGAEVVSGPSVPKKAGRGLSGSRMKDMLNTSYWR